MATAAHTELYQHIDRVLSKFGVTVAPILAERQHGKTLIVLLNGKRSRVNLITTALSEKQHHHQHVRWHVPKVLDEAQFFVPVLSVPGTEECFYALSRKEVRRLMQEKSQGVGSASSGSSLAKALTIAHPPRENSDFSPFLNAGHLIA